MVKILAPEIGYGRIQVPGELEAERLADCRVLRKGSGHESRQYGQCEKAAIPMKAL